MDALGRQKHLVVESEVAEPRACGVHADGQANKPPPHWPSYAKKPCG